MFCWNVVGDILELAQHPQYQDVTLVCNNGKMTCNSIVLALLSPPIRRALSNLQDADFDEMITIMCVDIDFENVQQFFINILHRTEEFEASKDLVDFLGNQEIGVKIEVDLQENLKVEESFFTENNFEDKDSLQEASKNDQELFEQDLESLIDIVDPLPLKQNVKTDVKRKKREDPMEVVIQPLKKRPKKNYDCEICFKANRSKKHLERHMRKHTKQKKIYVCEICSFKTGRKNNLERHSLTHFDVNGYKKCKTCKALILEAKFEEHSCVLFPCETCGKKFGNEIFLARHIQRFHEKRNSIACDMCGKLVLKSAMKDHKEGHYDKKIPCPECGKEFRSERGLKSHMKRHVEKTLCPICNKKVLDLKLHVLRMHTRDEDKNHQCDECGKGFPLQSHLQKHKMNVHIKARPFNCRYGCTFAYNDLSNRNAHEKKTHGKLFEVEVQ